MLKRLFLMILAAASVPAARADDAATSSRFQVGFRAGFFQMLNAHRSYSAVYGAPAPQFGADMRVAIAPRTFLMASFETASAGGEKALPANPPISTGVPIRLRYTPMRVSWAWNLRPIAGFDWYAGGGLTVVHWSESSRGVSAASTKAGFHALSGFLKHRDRWSWGVEIAYAFIPSAIGKAGISRFYDEHDVGGLAVSFVAIRSL